MGLKDELGDSSEGVESKGGIDPISNSLISAIIRKVQGFSKPLSEILFVFCKLVRMKSARIFTAISILSITNIFGAPTRRSTLGAIIVPAQQASDIEPSVDASPKPASAFVNDATATQYWVCIAGSQSASQYRWSQGDSESSALSKAKSKCGKSDCSFYSCQEQGCVGIDHRSGYVALSSASGYGSSDGSKAAGKALSTCQSHARGCGKPGHFCAQYVS